MPDRAGSRAGEGRARPGRTEEEAGTDPEAVDEDSGSGDEEGYDEEPAETAAGGTTAPDEAGLVPSPSSRAVRQAEAAEERPVGRMLRILPLGSGLVLIGMGLGLAFLGLRLRRG
ncbi:hypothetical protein [Streptomyces sp. NPDC017202]|uniref:hypothetical protein n=1 Tax=Streptomyces sp. NPDC017202 TaxID=3364981 RepID=UPI0037948263